MWGGGVGCERCDGSKNKYRVPYSSKGGLGGGFQGETEKQGGGNMRKESGIDFSEVKRLG